MIIAFTGPAGCGKSTAAEYLRNKGWVETGFAWPLKTLVGELFQFSQEQLYGPSEMRNAPDPRYPRADGTCLSPREALQVFGTEAGRKCYPEIWVEACKRSIDHMVACDKQVVLADLRFDNEAEMVRKAGGVVVRLTRQTSLDEMRAAHISEAGVSPHLIDHTIVNTGTKQALYDLIDRVLAESFGSDNTHR